MEVFFTLNNTIGQALVSHWSQSSLSDRRAWAARPRPLEPRDRPRPLLWARTYYVSTQYEVSTHLLCEHALIMWAHNIKWARTYKMSTSLYSEHALIKCHSYKWTLTKWHTYKGSTDSNVNTHFRREHTLQTWTHTSDVSTHFRREHTLQTWTHTSDVNTHFRREHTL